MLFDGIKLVEGSEVQNLVVDTGSNFPSTSNEGELFYRNDGTNEGLYVYDGANWVRLADGNSITGVLGYTPVNKAGDTMTGPLVLSADPTANLEAATKQYVDTAVTNGVPTGVTPGFYTKIQVNAAGKVTAGSNPTTLSGYGITDAQPLDADLTALANTATTGIYAVTGAGTSATRSIAVSGTGLSISNADGVSGNPTITSNATALNTASAVVARDASGNFAAGTITAALSGNASTATKLAVAQSISITGDGSWSVNFDGSGAATAALTLSTVNSAPQSDTFRKITVNGKGLVTATSAVGQTDITTALGYTPVNKAGDSMTGYLTLVGAPTNSLHAATKQYVDDVASGMNVKMAVRTATSAALTATYSNGSAGVGATLTGTGALPTINGVTLSAGDRILVKDQASQLQNGIYTVTTLSPNWVLTRATDFDNTPAGEVVAGDTFYVQEGTLVNTFWVQTTAGTITVGTSNITFTQFGGPGSYSAGTGIQISGTTISNTGVTALTAGTGVSLSGSTGSITVTNTGVTSLTGTANQITVSGSTGDVTLSLPSAITIGGVMTAGTFSGSGASLTSIPNAALVNSSLTIGSTSIALGATVASLAGLTSVSATTFTGALSGNATTATTAGNVTGTVAVANGGTEATTAEGACTNIGASRINPTTPKDGDIQIAAGPIISVYATGAWRQVFPAVYS